MQWLRSFVFLIATYGSMAVLALWFAPLTLFDRRNALKGVQLWCRLVVRMAERMVGLRVEIRGEVPKGTPLVVSKHQSFLDIIILTGLLEMPRFVMKREILYTPIVGFFAKAMKCVPVTRGKGAAAMAQMLEGFSGAQEGQIVIYPQGTRVPPGVERPYKQGAAVLYAATGRAAVPVAVNVGRFWPRKGILRRPGIAVVEFLDPIPPGRSEADFLNEISTQIEAASERLDAEALDMLGQG